jgi:hypothetical protein
MIRSQLEVADILLGAIVFLLFLLLLFLVSVHLDRKGRRGH